jgi:hypothetical protein
LNALILKLGATGDVVRTTPPLKQLAGDISWITAAKNVPPARRADEDVARGFVGSSAGSFATANTTRRAAMAISVRGAFDAFMDQLKAAGKVDQRFQPVGAAQPDSTS